MNPVTYFEIPAVNLDRAVAFYHAVFGYEFSRESIDGNEMALFPLVERAKGATGALAKGETYKPSKVGTLVYFETGDIDRTLQAVASQGGKTLYPRTGVGEYGFVAEFEDSEGNRVGLHAPRK
ncbi:MAG: VOC family protein [Bryobacteraceae bacterium]|nr:VOC family protein [Bryobacteraceae bacterium]